MDVVTSSFPMRSLCSPCLLALLSLAAVAVTTTSSEDVSLPHRRARGLIQAPATKEQPFGESRALLLTRPIPVFSQASAAHFRRLSAASGCGINSP
ncbi:hypothetical protein MRX96_029448 [Rhipicephalus microplus]